MTAQGERADLLRPAGWILGVFGALCGLLGPVLAGAADPTSFVGIASGSGVCVLGAVIIDRRPRNLAAWGFLAGGLLLVGFSLTYSWAAGQIRAGNTMPSVGTVAAAAEVVGALAGGALPLFQFLFPDGRLPSRRWRPVFAAYLIGWLGGAVAVAIAVFPVRDPTLAADMGPLPVVLAAQLAPAMRIIMVTEAFAIVSMLAGVVAVAVRLRGARGLVRSQVLLTLWGLGLTAALIAATALVHGLGAYGAENVTSLVAPLPFFVAVTIAMRRHRLFDVDRLVGRTITYAVTTAVLIGLYVVISVGLGALSVQLGVRSSVVVAAATLAVAAAFRPLLRVVRGLVDRRFDRRTWLAVRALDDFTRSQRSGTSSPADLVDALRRAVADATVVIAYVDGDRMIDLDGSPIDWSGEPRQGRLRRAVHAGAAVVAVVELDARLADEPRLVEAALASAVLPLENAALHARAAVHLAEVQASRSRIVAAEDTNRRRIERDLHDGAQQRLVALALRLRLAQRDLGSTDPQAGEVLADAVTELRETVNELRELTRGILPPVLADEGLAVALRATAQRLPMPVTLDVAPDRLAPIVEATAWYVACEGMANAVKHAEATTLRVSVHRAGDLVNLEIADDGTGGATLTPGGGIQGLADRVAAIGGRFTLSSPTGGGTRLLAELPCAS